MDSHQLNYFGSATNGLAPNWFSIVWSSSPWSESGHENILSAFDMDTQELIDDIPIQGRPLFGRIGSSSVVFDDMMVIFGGGHSERGHYMLSTGCVEFVRLKGVNVKEGWGVNETEKHVVHGKPPLRRLGVSLCKISDSKFVMYGGLHCGLGKEGLDDFWTFERKSEFEWEWTQIDCGTTNPGTRAFHSLSFSASHNAVFLFGGLKDNGNWSDAVVWKYGFDSGAWEVLNDQVNDNESRREHFGMCIGNSLVIMGKCKKGSTFLQFNLDNGKIEKQYYSEWIGHNWSDSDTMGPLWGSSGNQVMVLKMVTLQVITLNEFEGVEITVSSSSSSSSSIAMKDDMIEVSEVQFNEY
eukprot:TRINITY_DN2361_c1_g2_i3.p1 TRINITY_DN2361_c1_g2~~TRINITY_DN2361_c1_g2_i3.p1  ORF type:complete len:385 (-),score=115.56 TRINITY_DN2361_c1_g2_i3:518-1576(-)